MDQVFCSSEGVFSTGASSALASSAGASSALASSAGAYSALAFCFFNLFFSNF